MKIEFSKYHGAGNDFILIDGRSQKFDFNNFTLIKNLCNRRFGIGADGVMILLNDDRLDFKMLYFNSDGREGTMCGNGGRCITSFARSLGIINEKTFFSARDGIHEAIVEHDIIHLKMNNVTEIIELEDGFLINTGSPHFIKVVNNPLEINVDKTGRTIRNEERFKPGGVNVNFVSISHNEILIATFERGVEAETLSCGTGSVASAIAFSHINNNVINSYKIKAKGGELNVSFNFANNIYTNIWLSGPATHVFDGNFDTDNFAINNTH
jgi:diaminopimelate epimerase